MSYAVTNPATGETVRTYDTITDAELEAAIAAADEAHRTWSKSTTVEERAALVRRVVEQAIAACQRANATRSVEARPLRRYGAPEEFGRVAAFSARFAALCAWW